MDAGWNNDDQLVIETKGGRFAVEEVLSISSDKSRLVVLVELNGGKDNMVFKRVYERVVAQR